MQSTQRKENLQELHDLRRHTPIKNLRPPDHHRPDLHRDRNNIRAVLRSMCRPLRFHALDVVFRLLRAPHKLHAILLHIRFIAPRNRGFLVERSKFPRCARLPAEPGTRDAPEGVSDGDEEVGSGLSVRGLVSHVDEVLARLVGGAVVCHLALVDDTHFIEQCIERLGRLVDGDNCGDASDVGRDSEGAHELQGSRRVETAGRAVTADCQKFL